MGCVDLQVKQCGIERPDLAQFVDGSQCAGRFPLGLGGLCFEFRCRAPASTRSRPAWFTRIDFAGGYVAGNFFPTSLHMAAKRSLVWTLTLDECWLIVVKAVRAADHVRLGAGLLHDVGQFMRQQSPTFTCLRFKLTRTKHHVVSYRVGAGAQIPRGLLGGRAGMYAHP